MGFMDLNGLNMLLLRGASNEDSELFLLFSHGFMGLIGLNKPLLRGGSNEDSKHFLLLFFWRNEININIFINPFTPDVP